MDIRRTLTVDAARLTVEQSFEVERQERAITPALRIALPLTGPLTVSAGEYSSSFALPDGETESTVDLPEQVRAARHLELNTGGQPVRIELPAEPCQRLFVRLDRHREAALLVAVYPEMHLAPGAGRTLRVVLACGV